MNLLQKVRMVALMAKNNDTNSKKKREELRKRRDKQLQEAEDREIEDVNSWIED